MLNWDTVGNLTQLFPNKFDQNNHLRAGRTHTFPPPRADYKLYLADSGTEKLKVLVVADKRASEKINEVLSYREEDNPYRGHTIAATHGARVKLKKVTDLLSKEAKIAKILKGLDSDDWGEDRFKALVR